MKLGDKTSEGYSEENYCVGFCGECSVEKNDEIMTIVEIEGISKITKNSKRKQAKITSLFGSSSSVVKKRRDEGVTSGIRLNKLDLSVADAFKNTQFDVIRRNIVEIILTI